MQENELVEMDSNIRPILAQYILFLVAWIQ